MSEHIQYYYDQDKIKNDVIYDDTTDLQEFLKPKINAIKRELSTEFPNLEPVWTKKNTLGYVLASFQDEKKVIGKGAKALFNGIKNEFQFVIFSKTLRGKYKKIDKEDLHGIQINITYFNYIFSKVGDQNKIVELFLKDPKPEEIEKDVLKQLFTEQPEKMRDLMDVAVASSFLRQHAITEPEEIQTIMELLTELSQKYEVKDKEGLRKILDITIKLLDNYKIQNPEEFKKIAFFFVDVFEQHDLSDVVGLGKAIDVAKKLLQGKKISDETDLQKILDVSNTISDSVVNGHEYFDKKLKEFQDKLDTNEDEEKLRDFVYENIWLLDFRYFGYEKIKEEKTAIGDIDLSVYQNRLGVNRVIIAEFKRADEPTITVKDHGENKPVILSKVGRAISQTIHYIEEKKREHRFVDGLIIIGRKKELKDIFIEEFNSYLHGIKVMTFDDLRVNAEDVIHTFKNVPKISNSDNNPSS